MGTCLQSRCLATAYGYTDSKVIAHTNESAGKKPSCVRFFHVLEIDGANDVCCNKIIIVSHTCPIFTLYYTEQLIHVDHVLASSDWKDENEKINDHITYLYYISANVATKIHYHCIIFCYLF
jgi:hypothetical protein